MTARSRSSASSVAVCVDNVTLADALLRGLKDAGLRDTSSVVVSPHRDTDRLLGELGKDGQVETIVLAVEQLDPLPRILSAIEEIRSHGKPLLCFRTNSQGDFHSDVLDAALHQRGALLCRYPEEIVELACAFRQLHSHKPAPLALQASHEGLITFVAGLSAEFGLDTPRQRGVRVLTIPGDVPLVGARARVAALVRATTHLKKLAVPVSPPPSPPASAHKKAIDFLENLEATLTEREAKHLLDLYGIQSPREALVASASAAAAAAREIGFPITLRVVTPDIRNVTDVGGVATGVQNGAEARGAYARILVAAHELAPRARLEGVLVAKAAPAGVRLRVAARRHAALGAAIMLGSADEPMPTGSGRAVRVAPLTVAEASEMVLESAAARLLVARETTGVDLPSLGTLIHKTSLLAWDLRDALEEVDLTVVVRPQRLGCVVVDAGAARRLT